LSAFLVEMDGLEVGGGGGDDDDDESRASNVLVVATTNRPASLDVALMRPGRLDMVLYVPPPDARGREAALRVHARGVPLAPDVDLSDVARRAERFTGAELRGVIREAALAALRENMDARAVTAAHVDAALAATRPALAESDLAKWASFRA
jgi:SpoVK/Ycf46/Vps4 family AAA+-type ATPase